MIVVKITTPAGQVMWMECASSAELGQVVCNAKAAGNTYELFRSDVLLSHRADVQAAKCVPSFVAGCELSGIA